MNLSFFTKENLRLDEFLRIKLREEMSGKADDISNQKVRRLIVSGNVSVNGRVTVRPSFELRGRSSVLVNLEEDKFFFEKDPEDIDFTLTEKDVLFEDDYLIAVNKPAFFPVEETIVGSEKRKSLHDEVVKYLWKKNPSLENPPYCGIMHRLDKETSGVILFTKDRSVNKAVSEMFQSHDFKKFYIALCAKNTGGNASAFLKKNQEKGADGKPEESFTVEFFMNRISPKSEKAKWGKVSEEKGLYSKTDFKILGEGFYESRKVCIVQADLFTGRTHQIRVHLSEKKLPVLGDTLYGGKEASRIMLHAEKLEFNHPVTGKKITIEAACPFLEKVQKI